MTTTVALGSFCRRVATSSRMRLHTLSTRELFAGLNAHSLILLACGGGGGACTVKDFEASAAPPRPSSTRTVVVYVPGATPAVATCAVVLVGVSWPPFEDHVYVSRSPSGSLPTAVKCTISPTITVSRSEERDTVGGRFGRGFTLALAVQVAVPPWPSLTTAAAL